MLNVPKNSYLDLLKPYKYVIHKKTKKFSGAYNTIKIQRLHIVRFLKIIGRYRFVYLAR